MTPDEIIAMAKEAGMNPNDDPDAINALGKSVPLPWLGKLAALVAAKAAADERAAILEIAEDLNEPPYYGYENPNTWDDALIALSALIRARGDQ